MLMFTNKKTKVGKSYIFVRNYQLANETKTILFVKLMWGFSWIFFKRIRGKWKCVLELLFKDEETLVLIFQCYSTYWRELFSFIYAKVSFRLTSSLFCSDRTVAIVCIGTFMSAIVLNAFWCREHRALSFWLCALFFSLSVLSSAHPVSMLLRSVDW